MKKLAFCFLIYDVITLEELWEIFFDNVDPEKYAIYIHYKVQTPLKFFEQYKLTNCIETYYGDVSLIHAQNLMFAKAYEDGCDKMINVSQSCVPLKSFDYIYYFLTKDDLCQFNVYPNQDGCFPRCDSLLQFYKKEAIQKSAQWLVLNRTVCEVILNIKKDRITRRFKPIFAPEEHFYISTVFQKGLQSEIEMNWVHGFPTTFAFWHGMQYQYMDPSLSKRLTKPKEYNSISEEELNYLLQSDSLFARKFKRECLASFMNYHYIGAISV